MASATPRRRRGEKGGWWCFERMGWGPSAVERPRHSGTGGTAPTSVPARVFGRSSGLARSFPGPLMQRFRSRGRPGGGVFGDPLDRGVRGIRLLEEYRARSAHWVCMPASTQSRVLSKGFSPVPLVGCGQPREARRGRRPAQRAQACGVPLDELPKLASICAFIHSSNDLARGERNSPRNLQALLVQLRNAFEHRLHCILLFARDDVGQGRRSPLSL